MYYMSIYVLYMSVYVLYKYICIIYEYICIILYICICVTIQYSLEEYLSFL